MTVLPHLPGATSLTRLTAYEWPAPDGVGSVGTGAPHLHTASSEAYVVLAGKGRVQTLSGDGFAEQPLRAGAVVWFTPGVVHRLVNDGGLELVVVMSNAGLPESGDAVLTFPQDVLDEAERYRDLAALPSQDPTTSDDPDVAAAARTRRDLAIEGFTALRAAVESEGPAALTPLSAAAVRLVRARIDEWRGVVERGAVHAASSSVRALSLMAAGNPAHLGDATVAAARLSEGPERYGMCGRLRPLDVYRPQQNRPAGGDA